MASSTGSVSRTIRVVGPVLLSALAYGAYKLNAAGFVEAFFTGPGRTSRIVALIVVLVNWKSLPLAWTFRIFNAMITHILVKSDHTHPPSHLFDPVKTSTHVTLLEVDYNIHKSNSTYFADLDVSRTHLVGHLFARACRALGNNSTTGLVTDPSKEGSPAARGRFNIILGGVQCSFKREIGPYGRYEMWSRILSWDRKWMYVLTHFVEPAGTGTGSSDPKDWEKRIHASALSKYVFKIGRLTVHPAVLIEASGMFPERPGGWIQDETKIGDDDLLLSTSTSDGDNGDKDVWDWKSTERERRKGLKYAEHFAALDGLLGEFQPGKNGPLGRFGPG